MAGFFDLSLQDYNDPNLWQTHAQQRNPGTAGPTMPTTTAPAPAGTSNFNPTVMNAPAGTTLGDFTRAGTGSTSGGGNPMDRNWVIQQIQQTAQQMQARGQYVNPSVLNDPGYWADRIIEKGGWTANNNGENNIGYFTGRFGEPEGAPAGGGGGGGVLGSPLMRGYGQEFNYDPNRIFDSPAWQAASGRAMEALQRSAAVRGTTLNGSTLRDLSDHMMGLGLGAINDDFNRSIGGAEFNRGTVWGDTDRQFGRLYDFANLGSRNAAQLGAYGSGYGDASQYNAGANVDLTTGLGNARAGTELGKGSTAADTLANLGTNVTEMILRRRRTPPSDGRY